MVGELTRTDDGRLVWYNPATNTCQFVQLADENQEGSSTLIDNKAKDKDPRISASTSATSAANETGKSIWWTKEETLLLLSVWEKWETNKTGPKLRKTELYKKNSQAFNDDYGYKFTAEQCNNRIKTLTARNKDVKDHNNNSGESLKKWEYYDRMEEILGKTPHVNPEAGCSTIGLLKTPEPEPPSKKPKITVRNSPRNEMLKFLKEERAHKAVREEKKLEAAERHHRENKKLLQALINKL